jgi:maltooligosyltrehalose trehalohydrolase
MTLYQPQFGALVVEESVWFRVHAPHARDVRLMLHDGPRRGEYDMRRLPDGIWEARIEAAGAGEHYGYSVNGSAPKPDPASRFQPYGVHGPSEVVSADAFQWTDGQWVGPDPRELVVYELHAGTFTQEGTFAGAAAKLRALADLGVTAVELMPIADFAGQRNWGYDGAALFAPSRAYGKPDELRALVDRAHALGIAVILDVVYNHLGPEGAYAVDFNPEYLVDSHATPWGAAVNLDAPGCRMVRQFIIDNAVHWIREYHADGLRLDATHALVDDNTPHFLRQLAQEVRAASSHPVVLHAEDHRNLDNIVSNRSPCDWGFDGVWADDFHHVLRRLVAGDRYSYYRDYCGTTEELAATIRQGWLYTGQHSIHLRQARGSDPASVPMARCVVCIQNHDQIGNRAFGERLHHQVDEATWRAMSTVLLTAPMTPLLFMGQEWAASTPFQYFTDFEPELGKHVTEGRRREFRGFPEFTAADAAEGIPDPQAFATFESSRLRWAERSKPAHARVLALYRRLLQLRRAEPALQASTATSGEAFALDADTIAVRRASGRAVYWIIARLRGLGAVNLAPLQEFAAGTAATVVISTEDAAFAEDPQPLALSAGDECPRIVFARPGALVLKLVSAT